MQAWNQWSSQASASGGYPLAGFPPPVSAVPPPSAAAAVSASPIPPPLSGYPVASYQWPNYTPPTALPPTVGAYAGTQWPISQQSQHWEHWQQWQQQYSQWQQQYGDKQFAAANAAGLHSSLGAGDTSSQPSPQTSSQTTPTGNDIAKRALDTSGDDGQSPSQEPKKMRGDSTQSASDWSAQKSSTKVLSRRKKVIRETDNLEELSEAEKQFDEQFRNWETQFDTWREQNASHPDTEQYKAYESKWKSWREQLLQRREQMKKKREIKLMESAKLQQEQQKQASQASPSPGVSTTPSQSASKTAVTNTTAQQNPSSFPQTTVGMYGQMGFSGYPFNQQNYMFGLNTPTHTPAPSFTAAAQAMFHGVPPPALPLDLKGSNSTKQSDHSKMLNKSQQSEQSDLKDKQCEFIKTPSGNGIPGLDLLTQSGAHSKILGDAPSMILPPQVQLPIQTPADSKPFDFPPPSVHSQNSQNASKFGHQGLIPQMNMPPPGFPSLPHLYGLPPNISKANSFSQPPPHINKDHKNDPSLNRLIKPSIPSLMDGFDPNRGPPLLDRVLLKDGQGLDWAGNKPYNDTRNFGAGPSGDKFDQQNRFPFQGRNNETVNNFDRSNQNSKENEFFGDDRRANWRTNSPYRNANTKEGVNNFGGFPGGRDRDFARKDDHRHNNFQRNEDFGVENEEDEYERFHEYQQSADNQTEIPQGPLRDIRGDRQDDRQTNKVEGQRARVSRFTDREPFTEAPPEFYGNKFTSQNFPSRQQESLDLPREPFHAKKEPEFAATDYTSDRYGRWDYDKDDRALGANAKPDLPPLLEPAIIIDYRHQPADLGTPEFHEPATMFDYAHGAHVMPIGEEERFPHTDTDNRPIHTQDRWGPERERNRGGMMGGYNRMSPNRHWNDSRDRDLMYESRNKWSSPGPRGRDERRWEGSSKDDYKRDNNRSKDDSRGRDDNKGRDDNRGRDDRWRGDRGKQDMNHEERNKQSRDGDKKDKMRERVNEDRRPQSNNKARSPSPKPPSKPVEEQKQVIVLVDDILSLPGRSMRAAKIVIILRGPPGSGKTYLAKLIKDKEVEMGGSAPRILSLDDYFMTEVEKEEVDSESGKKMMKKVMEYEYEAAMEPNYRDSLTKSFKKTITDGYFPFIIVDCINSKVSHFEEMASFAKLKGFQIYICEMDLDLSVCSKRNIHKRTEKEIDEILKSWDKTPSSYVSLDIRSLLQDAAITEVDMEDSTEVNKDSTEVVEEKSEPKKEEPPSENKEQVQPKSDEPAEKVKPPEGLVASSFSSKWDNLDSSYEKLDRLDGLSKARRPRPSITDWLQLPEDYFETSNQVSGKKRVRWADLEERRQQEKMRAIGFVVGQTDWSRMLDPSGGQSKLTQTKYI